jgi:hypothetical protein
VGPNYDHYDNVIKLVDVRKLREVVGLLQQLEHSIMIGGHSVLHPVLWFDQFLFQIFRWYVVYLVITNYAFAFKVG